MMSRTDFKTDLKRVTALADPQQRGYQFQSLIGSLFKHYHFTVIPSPGTARPRQVDLLATRGEEVYLIETKWRKDPANIDDIDSLFTRLDSTTSSVIGIMISHAGITETAVARVIERSNRPVLLLTGIELTQLIEQDGDLIQLLHQKRSMLLTHRKVIFSSGRGKRVERTVRHGTLPPSGAQFILPDGRKSNSIACAGDFGQFTFVHELPDVDWVASAGFGVTADVAIPAWDESNLIDLLHQLSDMGWSTPDACWSIQQMNTNWHGLGASSFVEALSDWRNRYKGLRTHHSEEFCYFDTCDGGFYTLTANVAAHHVRQTRQALLSFQLTGIPLDTDPLRHLCTSFKVREPIYFRPMDGAAVTKNKGIYSDTILDPIAFVIDLDNFFGDPIEWVRGIVTSNPYYLPGSPLVERKPEWLPEQIFDSEYIICALRSWHPLDKPKSKYRLWGCESARTADARVVRLIAEWDD